jgi:3-deoxy-manno-octulosonate cytidylyltransferase (CMP-KDO synthetase)
MVHTETLQHLRSCFADPKAEFATLILPVTNPDDLENESEVFVTIDKNKHALYFSRSVIPYVRGVQKRDWIHHATIYKHIGIYGFTPKALQAFCKLPSSKLETCERLEQNRWLEAGNKVKTAITFYDSVPVDTPADLERVRGMMAHALYGH